MPWRETSPMDQKTQFIADYLRETLSVCELCDLYGISRKTAYKWIERYVKHGPPGLQDRSRKPSNSPNHTPTRVALCQGIEQEHAPPHRCPSNRLGTHVA